METKSKMKRYIQPKYRVIDLASTKEMMLTNTSFHDDEAIFQGSPKMDAEEYKGPRYDWQDPFKSQE